MPQRVQVVPASDWRGGLNYNADAFQLQENEVSDCMDVDFDPSGGFARRRAINAINTTVIGSTPKNVWAFNTADGATKQIVVQDGNDAAYSTGVNFTGINPDALVTTGQMHAAQAGEKLFVQRNAERAAFTWNGTTSAVLADSHGAYVDNLAAPTAGHMPVAKFLAYHRNYLFHANTLEGGTSKRSRVRFSHPASDLAATRGFEAYRTDDWIDVAPDDGDAVTGLVSWQDRLLIFKNNSVWQLLGYSDQTWQLENISHTVGAIGQSAIAVGDEGIYFFSWPNGLQLYDGRQINDLFYPLLPLVKGGGATVDNELIDETRTTNTAIGYVNQRCWVSLTTGIAGATTNDRVFIYDPRLGKKGGWTKYKAALGPFLTWHPPGADVAFYATSSNAGYVEKLEVDFGLDKLTASAGVLVSTPVVGYCYTGWYDEGNSALQKRWKHPIVVADADNTIVLRFTAYRDYDFYAPTKTFDVNVTAPAAGMLWDVGLWDVGIWGGSLAGPQTIVKGNTLGRGTSVALKIEGPAAGSLPWSINSIAFKFVARRIRG